MVFTKIQIIFKLRHIILNLTLDEFPEPKPATTTIATLLKRVIDKGFVGYQQHGSNREYFPKVKKTEYFSKQVNSMIKDYFNNSAAQFASFFTNETNLNLTDLEEIKRLIEHKIRNQKKTN